MIQAYYKLEMLSDEVKNLNGLRKSKTRLDCTLYNGNYAGMEPFKSKGMFYLYLLQKRDYSNIRKPDFNLNGIQSMNFTGLFEVQKNVYYGNPNGSLKLKSAEGDKLNPSFEFRNDLFMMLTNNEHTEIEIFVFPNSIQKAIDYAEAFINGEFEDEVNKHRETAKPFFNYKGL